MFKISCLLLCILSLSPLLLPANQSNCCTFDFLPYQASLEHIEGGGLGYSEGYTTLELFYTPCTCWERFQPFIDLREHCFNDGKQAANVGVGGRYLCASQNTVFGLNVYYDYRYAHKSLHQVGLGFEMLGPCFDLRVNGYLPVGDKTFVSREKEFSFDNDDGTRFVVLSKARQRALRGFDAEIGTCINTCWCSCFCSDLYIAAGPYYYSTAGHCGCDCHCAPFWGGRVRVEAAISDCWSIEFSTTFDSYYHTIVQGSIAFSIPFGPCCTTSMDCCLVGLRERALQPVERNEIIVTDKKQCLWKSNF